MDNEQPAKRRKPARTKLGKFLPVPEHTPEAVKDALERYIAGESVQTIAATYKVDRGVIYDWMLADLGPTQYHQLVTRLLVSRVQKADVMLEEAETPHHIARAREMARFARMDLERRRPHLYGQKQEVKIDISEPLADRLVRARQRVIDVEPEHVATQLVHCGGTAT